MAGLCATASARAVAPEALHRYEFPAIGTLVEVTVADVDGAAAGRARDAVQTTFTELDRDWNGWKPSTLTRLNAALARGERVTLPASIIRLLTLARTLSADSGGLFDPGVSRLVALWGFHDDARAGGAPPSAAQIAAHRRAASGIADLTIAGNRVWSRNRALQLDMNGIAKGHGLDRARTRLAALGVRHALINAGGDVCAAGSKNGSPWVIGIRHPRAPGVLATVALEDGECAFSSGDYERYRGRPEDHQHHLIDPRTGRPARGAIATTVLGHDGARTQPASGALLIAGPQAWRATARGLGIAAALLIDEHGTVEMTPAMARRVRF